MKDLACASMAVLTVLVLTVASGSGAVVTSGSGFVVHPDGYIVTNRHVINEAGVITVYIGNRSYEASVVTVSESTDLALLRIPVRDLKAAPLGNSLHLELLDTVVAMGYPVEGFGRDLTTSQGQLTAIRTNVPGRSGKETLQHDAVIYRGSSGGPLFNSRGEVIGVNFAMVVGSGLQFAIPINDAIPLLRRISGFNVREMGIAAAVIPAQEIVSRYRETVVYIECTPYRAGLRPSVPGSPTTPSPERRPHLTTSVCLIQVWPLALLAPEAPKDVPIMLPLLKVGWITRDNDGRVTGESGFNIGLGVSFRYYGSQGLQPGRSNWYWGWGTVLFIVPYLEGGVAWKLSPQEGGLVLYLGLWYLYPYLELSIQF